MRFCRLFSITLAFSIQPLAFCLTRALLRRRISSTMPAGFATGKSFMRGQPREAESLFHGQPREAESLLHGQPREAESLLHGQPREAESLLRGLRGQPREAKPYTRANWEIRFQRFALSFRPLGFDFSIQPLAFSIFPLRLPLAFAGALVADFWANLDISFVFVK